MVLFLSGVAGGTGPTVLSEFYQTLGDLAEATGGPYYLSDYESSWNFPQRGIYVFFHPSTDPQVDPPTEWSIARIGTVGVSEGSTATLQGRVRQHRGNASGKYGEGGGNHRGSVFRLHVGQALKEKHGWQDKYPHWGSSHRDLPDDLETESLRQNEHSLEQRVSEYIRSMPFLVIDIPGEPHSDCERARFEKNLIALVSHKRRTNPALMNSDWLGISSPRAEINQTGLWNINHVSGFYSESIINELKPYTNSTDPLVE